MAWSYSFSLSFTFLLTLLVFFLFLRFARLGPASGFLHWLLPLPGMLVSLQCEPHEGSVSLPAGSLARPFTAVDVHWISKQLRAGAAWVAALPLISCVTLIKFCTSLTCVNWSSSVPSWCEVQIEELPHGILIRINLSKMGQVGGSHCYIQKTNKDLLYNTWNSTQC